MERWEEALNNGNKNEARKILLEEAENQNQTAMFICGKAMLSGDELFEQNLSEGERWLCELSELNQADYSFLIGTAYALVDKEKAIRYFEKSMSNGNRESIGMLTLCCYNANRYQEAFRYAQMANDWRGAMVLGLMYDNGQYVQHSRSKAHEYYELAVQKGCNIQTIKDRAFATYYGSSAQGKYIVKRFVIAIVGSLAFLLFAALCAASQ